MKHFKYLVYVTKHKMYVFIECVKASSRHSMPSLVWLGLIHDWSKFRWSEFLPYSRSPRDLPQDEAFDQAWLYHQTRNRHHWQYYLSVNRKKEITVAEMPIKYTEEMLADWIGAARAKGQGGVYTPTWYDRVKDTLILGEATLRWVENAVDRLREEESNL